MYKVLNRAFSAQSGIKQNYYIINSEECVGFAVFIEQLSFQKFPITLQTNMRPHDIVIAAGHTVISSHEATLRGTISFVCYLCINFLLSLTGKIERLFRVITIDEKQWIGIAGSYCYCNCQQQLLAKLQRPLKTKRKSELHLSNTPNALILTR